MSEIGQLLQAAEKLHRLQDRWLGGTVLRACAGVQEGALRLKLSPPPASSFPAQSFRDVGKQARILVMRKPLSVLLLTLALVGATLAAQAPQRITSVEGITEYRLSNGLRVLLFPDATKPTITVNITYLVGSGYENYGETGMAHLLEHLSFKGTPKHPNVPQELTEHGARPNGTTWFDRTNYFETFSATDENLKWALDLESDRMVNSFIARKDLDSEMTVVRNEMEAGENDPGSILEERILSTAYLWHNYGHSTIGARSDVENVPIPRLQAFYHNYYQPDNAVLLVAGKFDPAKTLQLVVDYFGKIPKPTRELQKIYTAEPTQDGERYVTLRRVGDNQIVMSAYHIPAGPHPDLAPLTVLARILGDTPSGRLHKSLVETKKASGVGSFYYQLKDPGTMLFYAEVRKESSLDDAREEFIKTLDAAASTAATAEEVERARTALLKNIELTLNSSERVGLQLSEWEGQGDWRLYFLHRDRLRKVTPDDVQRVAAAYMKSSNRTLGVFIPTPKPDRAEIPTTPDVVALVKDYKGDVQMAQGEAFDPSPANIESRTKRSTLANGAELALLSKKTRGATVVATATFRFGDEKSLMNLGTPASLAGAMLMRGSSKHTRQQIQDELDKLKARVSISGSAPQCNMSIETVGENLPAVLRLVGEVLREPAFPDKEFELLKQEQLASIEEQKSDPQPMAFLAFQRRLNPYPKGDVRYVETLDEQAAGIKAADLAAVKKFYADFYGASNAQISVVGDFDEPKIAALVGELFGAWKSPKPFARLARPYKEVASTDENFEAPDKANAFFVGGQNLNVRDDDPDYPGLLLGNYMLGGGFLNSRLATRIRQKEGLSYGVGSQLSASPLDKAGIFLTFAIYAPQNRDKLEVAFKEEIARALKDGFTPEEVAAAKSGFLQGQQVSRAQDAGLARTLANDLFIKRTLTWDADFEKKVGALTPDQIASALRKYLDPSKMSIFKAGDFAKALK
jgi:zinc protease